MRHTSRLNVYQKGYTLYSGDGLSQYQEFPLDIQSSGISQNYLSAQRRIDSLLETQVSRWCFCVANNHSGKFPVTAYGCFLPIEDDKGRTGISFIHAIESDEYLKIDQVVVSISQLLLQQTIGQLSELIAGVAKGTVTSNYLLEFLTEHFKKKYPRSLNSYLPTNRPIKEIKQDCGGASAVTWLAMAISHLDTDAPWEIYEEYSHQTKLVSTVSSCYQATEKYLLSNYLYQIISDSKVSKQPIIVKPPSHGNRQDDKPLSDKGGSVDKGIKQGVSIKQLSSGLVALLHLASQFAAIVSLIWIFSLKNEVGSLHNEVESLHKQNAELRNTIESLIQELRKPPSLPTPVKKGGSQKSPKN